MIRKIIKIDNDKCIGCGECVSVCNEGAIGFVNGKAALLREDHCEALGNCLPVCPAGAIVFEEREAAEHNRAAAKSIHNKEQDDLSYNCRVAYPKPTVDNYGKNADKERKSSIEEIHLNHWPIQIKLMPLIDASFYNADLLFAADCSAYAYSNFRNEFMKNRLTFISCGKFDRNDYSEKLTTILKTNRINSVTIVRMNMPCCSGIEIAVKNALRNCNKLIPWKVALISIDGKIVEDNYEE